MTDERKRRLSLAGKYVSIAAAAASALYGTFATMDYAGRWLNTASVAIQELKQTKQDVAGQRDDLREIKKDLAELRQDVTRLLVIARPLEPGRAGHVKIVKAPDPEQ